MKSNKESPKPSPQDLSALTAKGLKLGAAARFLGDGVIAPCQGRIEVFYAPKSGRTEARVLMSVSGKVPENWPYATREFAPRVADIEPLK